MKIKTGIVGSAGYTGGEILRLLLLHPQAEIVFAQSKSNAGKKIYAVHHDLFGETEMEFVKEIPAEADILFLCSGHNESRKFLQENNIGEGTKIIDLGQDFRVDNTDATGRKFVYGLSEWNREEIAAASFIANPGCFATAIQLALLPLAAKQLLKDEIHVSATTGSTGAGQSFSETSHFSWRNNNISSYKAFMHQHLGEIMQSILLHQADFSTELNFIPNRGNFSRGIYASVYMNSEISAAEAKAIFRKAYSDSAFVHICETTPDLKQVVNTNKCFIGIEKHGRKLLITSVIDNLLKGASGQAVQNMNIMFGLPETSGLQLKAVAF
jgi:N-acetyl-gamma-glutamyl-phosphate reductase